MHYVTFLDDRSQKIGRARRKIKISLRGYDYKTWVPADLSHIALPVYMIAYSPCPKLRDIYLEVVQGLPRQPTWERYKGRLIDSVYKLVHRKCESYLSSCNVRNFDIYTHLINEEQAILDEAKNRFSSELAAISPPPSPTKIASLDEQLRKVVGFESSLIASLMNFQIAKVRAANPMRIFRQYFDFNIDLALTAPHQGIRGDATPDFIYRHKVIGDIKSGKWEEFFEQTIVAYALAYEEHTGENMDYGVILHVEFTNRRVPSHHRTKIDILDDAKRKRYLLLRERKFAVIESGNDPGMPNSQALCDPGCSFLSTCWGGSG